MMYSASDQVFRELSKQIQEGVYAVGDKMPTEQNLCATLKVGRSTVREAMRGLQAQGYVNIRRGSGAYVIAQTGNGGKAFSQWVGENRDSMTEYMIVRIAVEKLAVRLFIQNYEQENMDRLWKRQADFEEALASGNTRRIAMCDEMLHSEIARSSSNRFLEAIDRELAEAFREYRYYAFQQTDFFSGAIAEHRAILLAISFKDTDTAAGRIDTHLQGSLVNTFNAFQSGVKS